MFPAFVSTTVVFEVFILEVVVAVEVVEVVVVVAFAVIEAVYLKLICKVKFRKYLSLSFQL